MNHPPEEPAGDELCRIYLPLTMKAALGLRAAGGAVNRESMWLTLISWEATAFAQVPFTTRKQIPTASSQA